MPEEQNQTPQPKKIDEDVKKAIQLLREDYDKDVRSETKTAYKNTAKKRGFYKGDPVGWYDANGMQWLPSETAPEGNSDDAPSYCYVLNIVQASGLILISAIASSGVPGNIFIPADPQNPQDIRAAKQAKHILELQAREVNFFDLWVDIFLYFYTDGPVLSYTRHVRSGTRFGTTDVAVQTPTEREVQPEGIICPECQVRVPLDQAKKGELGGMYCPTCNSPMDGSQVQPAVQGPGLSVETRKEPNGKELVTLYGVLESRRPFWCKELKDHPWIGTDEELSVDSLCAEFPEFADKIQGDTNDEDGGDREARMRALSPVSQQGVNWSDQSGGPRTYMRTYRRRWYRPETYFHRGIEKEVREKLTKLYPAGMFCQFAGSELLDVINERMDDHLDLAYPLPGKGAYPPAMADNLIPVQEGLNTAFNLKMEAMEYAAFAPVIVDKAILSPDITHRKMRPADLLFAEIPAGKTIEKAVHQIEVKDIAASIQKVMDEVLGWVDFLVGAGGALRGGSVQNTRTSQAYAQARNQSMQRLAIAFQAAKNLKARIEEKLVAEFCKNRTRDEVFAVPGAKGKDFEARTVGLSLARGRVMAFAENSETVPTTQTQKQAWYEKLMDKAANNPILQGVVSDPNNLELMFQVQGVSELTVPGRSEREMMLRRLEELAQSEPTQGPPQPGPDGQMQPGQPVPSIPFDVAFDNPQVCLGVIREWVASGRGEEVSPAGMQNIRAFAMQCVQEIQKQAQQQQPPQKQIAKGPQKSNVPAVAGPRMTRVK